MLDFIPEFSYETGTYIFISFAVFASIQLLFTLIIYSRLAFHKEKNKEISSEIDGVSIIIAARNESDNLYNNLPFILEQNFKNFEVIIINHQSMDDTKYILDAYTKQYPHLKIITVERSKHLKYGKKLPITIGIKGAKYEHLLFTDADCKPASPNWLKSMVSHFDSSKEIVLGYGPYEKVKGFLNTIIRFDTAWIAMNYLSMAKARIPYMGIGRNMAYTKTAFDRVSGFKSHYSLSSGDDDLFIQEAAKKKNYIINTDPNSYCYSKAPDSWGNWFSQKSRHYTTTDKYKVIKKLMLGIYPLTLLLMMVSFVTLLLDSNFVLLTLACFVFLLIVKWVIMGLALRKINESKFIVLLPLLDIFYAILAPIMFYSIDKTDKKKW